LIDRALQALERETKAFPEAAERSQAKGRIMSGARHRRCSRGAPHYRYSSGRRGMMKILHAWTSNGPNGPSPPPGDGWVSIRSVDGSTFWRLIKIESDPPQTEKDEDDDAKR
jgi:hypothetical protein